MANIANAIKGVEVATSLGKVHVFRVNFKAIREISEALRANEELAEEDFVRLLFGSICRRGTPEGGDSMHYLLASDLERLSDGDRYAILRALWESQAWGAPIPEDQVLVGRVFANVRKEIDRFNEHTAKLLQPLQGVLGKSTTAMFFKSAGLAAQLQELSEFGRATSFFRRAQDMAGKASVIDLAGGPSVAKSVPLEPPRIAPLPPIPLAKDYSGSLRAIESTLDEILELDRTAAEAIAATQSAVTSALLELEARRLDDQRKESKKLFWAVFSLFLTVGIAAASLLQDYLSNVGQDAHDAAVLKLLEAQRHDLEGIGRVLSAMPAAIDSHRTQVDVSRAESVSAAQKGRQVESQESKRDQGKVGSVSSQGSPLKAPDATAQHVPDAKKK